MKNAGRSLGAGALIVLLTVVAYLPALRGGFVWDDDAYVTENPALRSLAGLGKIWTRPGVELQYYPLAFTGFWVQFHLWHLHPFPYHLVNILLHALNAVLLWTLLRRLELPSAWWAAAIFALHPAQVESVAWVTQFKNVLSGTFSLLAVLAFLRFRPVSTTATDAPRDRRFYALAIALFVCALLSKTAVCCLPLVIAVLLWWKLDRIEKRDVLALIPWFLASLTLGLVTVLVESRLPETSPTGFVLSIVQRGLLAGRALWFYASKVVWPYPVTFIYPRWKIDGTAVEQYLFPAAALAVLIALWVLRRRIGKGPLAGALCFGALLLPVLGFFDIYFFRYSYVTDHFQYLACIGLIALASNAGATLARRAGQWGHGLGVLAAGVVLLAFGVSTWGQTHIYKDLETLWRDTLAKNPNAWMAHNNLGTALEPSGRVQEAIEQYELTLRIKPDYAVAHYNWGGVLFRLGRVQEAVGHWNQALRLDPHYAEAHYNLGLALAQNGQLQEAIGHYEQALRDKPDYPEAHNDLAVALIRQGKIPEAILHGEQAVHLKPDYAEAHNNLGGALEQAGRMQEAIEHYAQALRIKPDYAEAHYNWGVALARVGRVPEAIEHWNQALRIKPDYAEVHYNLGVVMEQVGRVPEAIEHYEQALRINPSLAAAQKKLARLQASR